MLLLDVAEAIGGIWWRTLEKEVHSRWDLLKFLAHQRLRHPERYELPPEPEEDVDPATLQRQQAEARALLDS